MYENDALNEETIVINAVEVTAGHPPEAAIVLVIVSVTNGLADRFTKPVAELITVPNEEVNVPATPPPLNVGNGLVLL